MANIILLLIGLERNGNNIFFIIFITMNKHTSKYYIDKFSLMPHPEGGYFKEVYRSDEFIPMDALDQRYAGQRDICTSIYFLLEGDNFSAFHKIKSDEIWHHYDGSTVMIHIISPEGIYSKVQLGKEDNLQYTIKSGNWFAGEVLDKNSFVLLGCTVAPGFDFSDFEIANRAELIKQFPEHQEIINRLALKMP